MKVSKIMAVTVAAVFCVTAFGIVFSDESSAADSVGHNVYVEIIGDDGIATAGYWMYFESDNTAESFCEKGNAASAALLLDLTLSKGDGYISLTYKTSFYNATYAAKDGAWSAVEDTEKEYPAAETLYFALGNGYISSATYDALNATEKAKWKDSGYGGSTPYTRVAQVAVDGVPEKKTYHTFVEVIDEAGKVTESKWINFDGYKTETGFVCFGNIAYQQNDLKLSLAISKYGGISTKYDNSGSNHSCVVEDGKWVHVTDTGKQYVEDEAVGFSVGHGFIGDAVYNALSDDDKKNWESSGMADPWSYQKVITESVDGYKDSENNNLRNGLIIGGVVAVILIAALAFFFVKKK